MRIVVPWAFLAIGLVASPAFADGADVAYSSTAKAKGCRVMQQPPPGSQDEHAPTIYHCGGTAGFGVRMEYLGATVHIKIAKGDLAKAPLTLGAPYDVGPAIEWRGVRATNGFRAHAAIIRLIALAGPNKPVSVLAVLRIDGNKACAAAFIDATAVPNANAEARVVADRIGGSFRCGSDEPMAVGPRTELIEEIASRGGLVVK